MSVTSLDQKAPPPDDLLWQHLKSVPAFRALLRAVEARFYHHLEIPEPVLDLGCGDGHFASLAFPSRTLTAGIDPWWNPLQKAHKAEKYNLLTQGLGHEMPFPDHYFASVISNSVLEHIPDINPVLVETGRVLRPGGRLVVTMPSHFFTENLAGARLFGDPYRRFFNTISRHAHTDPPEVWNTRLNQAGFEITRWQYYFSTGALRALELGHLQGLPSAVMHALTGHWIIAPWQDNLRLTERWVRPYYEESFPDEGAYLLIVARKVANRPVKLALPSPQPFTQAELAEPILSALVPDTVIGEQPTSDSTLPIDEIEIDGLSSEVPATAMLTDTQPATLAELEETPAQSRSTIIVAGLGILAILFAVLGQGSISNNPAEPGGGLRLYALGLLCFGALVVYLRRGAPSLTLPQLSQTSPRRWLYLAALLFAFVAQRLVGPELSGGPAILSLLLWIVAIGVALFSLVDLPERSKEAGREGEPPEATNELTHHGDNIPASSSITKMADTLRKNSFPVVIAISLFLAAFLLRIVNLSAHPFVLNGVEASLGLDAVAIGNGVIRNPFAVGWLTNPTLPTYLLLIPLELFGRTVFGVRILSALVGALTIPVFYLLSRRIWGENIALVAAILLCGAHVHLHYSRLGMNNIWDPFLIFLSLALLVIATRQKSRHTWLWTGGAAGASFYFYTPSHLLPIILVGVFIYLLVFHRETLRIQGSHMLAALGLALVIALPLLLFYLANEGVFMQRVEALGIFHSGWLGQETIRTGRSSLALLQTQFWQAALAFNASIDTSSSYNPGIPFFRTLTGILFAFGLVLGLVRFRRFAWAILLIWLIVVILFAGALLILPPDSHRLLSALPAACLLAAAPLVWLFERLPVRFPGVRDFVLPALALIAVFLVAGDVLFYYGPYRSEMRFADRNTEIAHGIATYLSTLEDPTTAYLYGPPTIYADFPTIPFLAPNFSVNFNLFNVLEPGAELEPPRLQDTDFVYLFLPERAGELNEIQAAFPGGEVRQVPGHYANPLFLAYEVDR